MAAKRQKSHGMWRHVTHGVETLSEEEEEEIEEEEMRKYERIEAKNGSN